MRRFFTWKWLGRATLALLVVVLTTPLIYHVVVRAQGRRELDAVLAQLDRNDPGWRLDDIVRATNAKLPPDDRNPFVLATAANDLLPPNSKERSKNFPVWPAAEPNVLLDTATKARFVVVFRGMEPTIDLARGLADLPDAGGNVIVMPANPLNREMGRESDLGLMQRILRADAVLLAEDGKYDKAVRSVRAALATARALGDDPSCIGQRARVGAGVAAVRAIEGVLNLGEPGAGLAELQAELVRESEVPKFLVGMRGERACFERICAFIDSGAASDDVTAKGYHFIEARLQSLLIQTHLGSDQAFGLQLLTRYIAVAELPPYARLAALQALPSVPLDPRKMLTRILIPYVKNFCESTLRSQGELAAVAAGIACERHRRRFGHWPATLADIPKDILAAVPTDPGDGKPLKYKRLADRIVVYSVGPDGIDHGGDLSESRPQDQRDYGIRLYDVPHRRQPAPPAPDPMPLPGDAP